ncbi:MAG: tail fiber domain-containing protein, partial [Mesorhizobium sp.]
MDAPSPPTPPDPDKTAAAQTGMNIDTAQAQQLTNMTNQQTPYGSLTYNQTGTRSFVDSSGKTVTIPTYTATQTLSPDQQKLFDLSNQTKAAIGQIGLDETGKIGSILNSPLDLSDTSIDDTLYNQYSPRVIAQQNQQNDALQAQMAAQGVTPGSEAYNNAMRLQNQSNTDQWNQLYLNGRGQAIQQMLTQRQEPINEISALMGGSQVQSPNFTQ